MSDLIFITAIVVFFAAAIAYIAFCSRLNKGEPKQWTSKRYSRLSARHFYLFTSCTHCCGPRNSKGSQWLLTEYYKSQFISSSLLEFPSSTTSSTATWISFPLLAFLAYTLLAITVNNLKGHPFSWHIVHNGNWLATIGFNKWSPQWEQILLCSLHEIKRWKQADLELSSESSSDSYLRR